MTHHVICRSLSVAYALLGMGGCNCCQGATFRTRWGGGGGGGTAVPLQGCAGSGAGSALGSEPWSMVGEVCMQLQTTPLTTKGLKTITNFILKHACNDCNILRAAIFFAVKSP